MEKFEFLCNVTKKNQMANGFSKISILISEIGLEL